VTYRKKKLLLIQISIFIFACSLIFFSYYNQNSQILPEVNKSNNSIEKKKLLTEKESNTFENVEYNGIDLNGNRYLIKSENADFDVDKPELINMKVMQSIFYFKDGTTLYVTGDYGTYNNKTNDMTFRDNIVALYLDNKLYADNLDYFNTKSLLIVYGNVQSESPEGNIEADNLKVDLSTKTLNLSMFNNNGVKVKLK
jgi:LPS export ABC transporter protein LptC